MFFTQRTVVGTYDYRDPVALDARIVCITFNGARTHYTPYRFPQRRVAVHPAARTVQFSHHNKFEYVESSNLETNNEHLINIVTIHICSTKHVQNDQRGPVAVVHRGPEKRRQVAGSPMPCNLSDHWQPLEVTRVHI